MPINLRRDILMANSVGLKYPKLSTSDDRIIVVDRISSLPDCLLCHILSFLPTKHAIGTSILSTRWKFLLTSITNMDFDDELLLQQKSPSQTQKGFVNFVNRVLILLSSPRIDKFRLKCGKLYDWLYINTWINTAVGRGVQELDFSTTVCSEGPVAQLPRNLFTCSTLVVLKLGGNFLVDISTASVNFPSLKILHLISVIYANDESVNKLFRSCPILEDLVIESLYDVEVYTFDVYGPVLKRLKIHLQIDDRGANEYSLHINAPALEYLDLGDHRSTEISLQNLSSLVEADIDVDICARREIESYGDVCGILSGISNVKILSLSENVLKALSFAPEVTPMFDNLTSLTVFDSEFYGEALKSLLENSPKLEDLFIN